MKAVVVPRCGQTTWMDVPEVPEPGEYQALARVRAFSICNSTDRHLRDCRLAGVTAASCPFLLGHEAVGEVVALGPKCRHLRIGDQVLRPMAKVEGLGSYWGGFAQYGLVSDRLAWEQDGRPACGVHIHHGHQVLPPEIAPGAAVILITLKEVLSYLDRIRADEGTRLLVLGHGPVGLAAAYLGRLLLGCERIVVAGRRPEAEAQVVDFGAHAWVDLREPEWPRQAQELLKGPATCVYDTTGQPHLIENALTVLTADGILGPYAARPSDAAGDLPEDPRLISAATDEGLSHDRIVAAVLGRQIDPAAFISHVLPAERVPEGFDLIARREAIKVVFEP